MVGSNLRDNYLTLEVNSSSNALGHGRRVVYWVGGAGSSSVVFNTVGTMFVLPNTNFSIVSVLNVGDWDTDTGRLRYRASPESPWADAGPLTPQSVRDDDLSLKELKEDAEEEDDDGIPY